MNKPARDWHKVSHSVAASVTTDDLMQPELSVAHNLSKRGTQLAC